MDLSVLLKKISVNFSKLKKLKIPSNSSYFLNKNEDVASFQFIST
jgi:hypothetical protein